jgi:hypothetical protein
VSDATCTGIARRTVPVLWMFGLALLLLPRATPAAPPAAASQAVQREIALIGFYGGGSALTAEEKREAANMVQREMQAAPKAEEAADAGAAKLLQVLQQAPARLIAFAREGGRLNVQLHLAVDPALKDQQLMEARIIEAHDPVVVFDPEHKWLVTVQTLRVLQHADMFGATLFGMPPPGPGFISQMQQIVPRSWAKMDTGMQEAMAHAGRDMPYAPAFLHGIDPGMLAGFVKKWRGKIMAPSDAAVQQLNLAEVMAVIGMTAFRHSQSGSGNTGAALAYRSQLQDLVNRKLQEAVRSYSPTCNVTRPDFMQNWASCHP